MKAGERFHKLHSEAGISHREVAKLLKVSARYVSKIENGEAPLERNHVDVLVRALNDQVSRPVLDQVQDDIDALYAELHELPPDLQPSNSEGLHGLIEFLREYGWDFFERYPMILKEGAAKHIRSAVTESARRKAELEKADQLFGDTDPFDLPYETGRDLGDEEYWSLTERLEALYGGWIQKMFDETGAQALVLCDRRIALASEDRYGISDEEVEEVGKRTGRACYVVLSPPLIEENVTWSDLGGGDYYPTVEVYLGNNNWGDDELFQRGVRIRSDFDTGSRETVFDEGNCKAVSDQVGLKSYSHHLGRRYACRLRQMKIGMTDGKTCRCVTKYVEGVENWGDPTENPYRIVNPNREGFVGRLLMNDLLAKITLDPTIHASEWELL